MIQAIISYISLIRTPTETFAFVEGLTTELKSTDLE